MNLKQKASAAAIIAAVGVAFAGTAAQAQDIGKILHQPASRQGDKNNMRNIGVGAGAAAAYEALHGRGTHALILGAGAAYAGKKYEDARKAQSRASHRGETYQYTPSSDSHVANSGYTGRTSGHPYNHGAYESAYRHNLNQTRKERKEEDKEQSRAWKDQRNDQKRDLKDEQKEMKHGNHGE